MGQGVDEVAEHEADLSIGIAFDGFQGTPADAGNEALDDSLQAEVVVFIEHEAQISQDVFAFLSFKQVELVDAGDRQLLVLRVLLVMRCNAHPDQLSLAVVADEDAGLQAFFRRKGFDFPENPAGFLKPGAGFMEDDGAPRSFEAEMPGSV